MRQGLGREPLSAAPSLAAIWSTNDGARIFD